MMEKCMYRHYGSRHFHEEYVNPIKNIPGFTKPCGGFWGVPEGNYMMWTEFVSDCLRSHSIKEFFRFELKSSNVYRIKSIEDIKKLPLMSEEPSIFSMYGDGKIYYIDFEKVLKSGIDAIEVIISANYGDLYHALYTWDIDSILVLNPEIIREVI